MCDECQQWWWNFGNGRTTWDDVGDGGVFAVLCQMPEVLGYEGPVCGYCHQLCYTTCGVIETPAAADDKGFVWCSTLNGSIGMVYI